MSPDLKSDVRVVKKYRCIRIEIGHIFSKGYLLFCCCQCEVALLSFPAVSPREAPGWRCLPWPPPPVGPRAEPALCKWRRLAATAEISSGSSWAWLDGWAGRRCARSPDAKEPRVTRKCAWMWVEGRVDLRTAVELRRFQSTSVLTSMNLLGMLKVRPCGFLNSAPKPADLNALFSGNL